MKNSDVTEIIKPPNISLKNIIERKECFIQLICIKSVISVRLSINMYTDVVKGNESNI